MSETTSHKRASLRLTVIERMIELFTAALTLVAALAWNDAIQSLFKQLFGEAASLYAKFVYATFLTLVAVIFVSRLTRVTEHMKERLSKD